MPIYPHWCKKCDVVFDVHCPMSETPDNTCVECNKPAERLFTVPNAITPKSRFNGVKLGGAAFDNDDPETQKRYTEAAKKAGVSIQGKSYQPGLARFPGDPRAFVEPDMDTIKKTIRERGLGCKDLGIKPRDEGPIERVGVAESLVERECQKLVASGQKTAKEVERDRGEIADRMTLPHLRGKYKAPRKTPRGKKR